MRLVRGDDCKIFEIRNKNIEYLRRFWAKQKIIRQGKRGLCFLPEVVYNKIAVSWGVYPAVRGEIKQEP